MQYTGLLTLGVSIVLLVIATRIARDSMQREYPGFRGTRGSLSRGGSRAVPRAQQRLSKKDMTFIAIILVTVLFLLILSRHIWYMPLNVPSHAREAAYHEKPEGLVVTDERQGVSPLHYRVQLYGRRNAVDHVFTYTASRFTEGSNAVLTVSDGREADSRFIWIIVVFVLGILAHTAYPYVLGKPCPNCGSKPFRLIDESVLSQSQVDRDGNTRPMVCEGHYACEPCGYNQILVYEGSKLNPGERAQTTVPLEHDDRAFLYRDDIGPGLGPERFDEQEWQRYYRQLQEEREREWMSDS